MANVVLHAFIAQHRDTILQRWGAMVATRSMASTTEPVTTQGIHQFLDHLGDVLRLGQSRSAEIRWSAAAHGQERLREGYSVSQVVHDFGDVCQAVTGLAVDLNTPADYDSAIAALATGAWGQER